ncbi:MAG: hypothetical protein AAF790_01495 [Planctomycetota bacterium]
MTFLFRFRIKHLLAAIGVVAIGLGLGPELHSEMNWRAVRERLRGWAERLDAVNWHRESTFHNREGVVVDGRFYTISCDRIYSRYPGSGISVVASEFPEQSCIQPAKESPYGPDAGYFIVPQCIWVETVEDAVAAWRRTTEADWRRYEAIAHLCD